MVFQLTSPFEEIACDPQFRPVRQRVLRLDQNDAVAFGERDRRRQDLAPDVVPARADPDRNGERQAPGNRQARVFEKHPDAELVILQHMPSP
jgi:hypothetical protein